MKEKGYEMKKLKREEQKKWKNSKKWKIEWVLLWDWKKKRKKRNMKWIAKDDSSDRCHDGSV